MDRQDIYSVELLGGEETELNSKYEKEPSQIKDNSRILITSKNTGKGSLCVFCCCFICCAIPGIIAILMLNNYFGDLPTVDAVVTNLLTCPKTEPGEEASYKISFNFTTLEGDDVSVTTEYCSILAPKVNDTVKIYYSPADPELVVQESLVNIGYITAKVAAGIGWSLVLISFCVGIFFLKGGFGPSTQTTSTAGPVTYY